MSITVIKKTTLFLIVFVGCVNMLSAQTIDAFKPIYKENGGKRKSTIFNKKKRNREKIQIEILTMLDQMKPVVLKDNTGQPGGPQTTIDSLIKESAELIDQLYTQAQNINIRDVDSYEQLLNLLKEVRDLKCKRMDPIYKFLRKNTKKLYGDISFSTGSSNVSRYGTDQIKTMVSQIEADILEWREYVNECNQKVFENDLYILVVDIAGYADQQGGAYDNILLSEERANAVKLELIKELNGLISKKVNIIFDKIYVKGYGEELPIGTTQKGEDDPERRVCLITSLVGPSALLNR